MSNILKMSLESRREWILPKKTKKDFVDYLLESRKILQKDDFLNPSISQIYPWKKLHDSRKAAKSILESVKNGEKIVIHADYDADGICACSLLWDFLYRDLAKHFKKEISVVPYIPNRIEQGYGLTEDSLKDVLDLGAQLVISVDCGVRDKELIKRFRSEKSLKFVITDHHQPPEGVLENLDYPLVHQMYPGKEYPQKEICGTAVVFLLIQAIKELAGMESKMSESTKGLDLVALATVTDIMPLVDVNRVFVSYGLKQIRESKRIGLRSLILRAGIEPKDMEAYHLGYIIGPRINAAGRIGSPMEAVRLLVSEDESKCKEISNELENLNFDRQKITQEILEKAKESVNPDSKLIFIIGKDWHEGVIGLVAGKLQEEYYRPVLVATGNEGVIKGSARSIPGFNITKALEKFSKYLYRYGGHELAAGFTLKIEESERFVNEITEYAEKKISDEQLKPKLNIDLALDTEDISYDFIHRLKLLEPFGFGNPKPTICLQNLIVVKKNVIGKESNHLKLLVKGNGIDLLSLLLFGCQDDVEKLNIDDSIDVVGYPDINVWNGNESIQFNVKEWRFSK